MTGRGLQGRQQAQALLFIGFAVVVLEVVFFVSQPNFMRPMFNEPPPIVGWLIPVAGVAVQVLGLAWMIRIYRADPEGHASSFRFSRP
jgi:Flp pilus assembly protein TadB